MEYFYNFEKLAYIRGKKKARGCVLCAVRDGDSSVIDLSIFCSLHCLVSLNLYPYNPGHLLVFPKRHIEDIRKLSREERVDLDDTIDKALTVLDRDMGSTAYNIGCNMGLVAGASIDHVHWHIIPRYPQEIGIIELIAGKRVLVEHPLNTRDKLSSTFKLLFS